MYIYIYLYIYICFFSRHLGYDSGVSCRFILEFLQGRWLIIRSSKVYPVLFIEETKQLSSWLGLRYICILWINIEWTVFHIRLMRSTHCLFGPLKSFYITFHSSCHRMIQDITYCWWAHPSRKGGLFFFHGHWWGISDISGFTSGWDRKVCAMPVTSSVAWGNYWNRCDRRLDQLAAVKCAAFVARPGGPGSTWIDLRGMGFNWRTNMIQLWFQR
jgi:hypothetical protein